MTVVIGTGRVHVWGPLAEYVEGLEAELGRLGFASASVVNQLRLGAHLSRGLDAPPDATDSPPTPKRTPAAPTRPLTPRHTPPAGPRHAPGPSQSQPS